MESDVGLLPEKAVSLLGAISRTRVETIISNLSANSSVDISPCPTLSQSSEDENPAPGSLESSQHPEICSAEPGSVFLVETETRNLWQYCWRNIIYIYILLDKYVNS